MGLDRYGTVHSNNEEKYVKLSRFLCFLLRHNPDAIGLELDVNGYVDTDELIKKNKLF